MNIDTPASIPIINLPKKIFITGGTGFLGAYIIKALIEQGYHVKALRRSQTTPSFISPAVFQKVEWVEGDILDIMSLEDAMENIDAVIHSAAVVSFVKKGRRNMYQVNIDGTSNVVNTAIAKKVKRFVHVSSVAALGRTLEGGNVNEEKKWEESKANTHYARSKYKAELEVWRGIGEGLPAVIINPSTILGYGNWDEGSSGIFKNIFNEFKWYTPGINGFVDVEDVARATMLLLESGICEERFIINGDTWSFKKLQDTIADYFGRKRPAKSAGPALLAIAWRIAALRSAFTGKKPLLTKESARVAISKTSFENSKFLRTFPEFSFTPLEDTIKKACEKYLGTVK